ncbi:hypothetical protein BOX15_Mlig003917g1 [Macrostomum lignano]|uniref:RRM domain-containing protein n=2 Tax=Macrostomum lignano TaxID=282301 RepID=A0A267EAL4_9PLAT|nr:hypothetical protein BOX15_Mlig003917g5 [Macrostomum lignano]PAA87652.1 hypothetical protein BOX15_Mlig003917g1 [Macrostomum lignano]
MSSYSMPTMDSSCTLIVHGLPHNTTPDILAKQMGRWGQVDRVLLCPDPGYVHADTLGSLVGPLWALVAYVDPASAVEALNSCQESNVFQLRRYRSPTDPPFDEASDGQLMMPNAAGASATPTLTGQLELLRAKCAELQAENQRLASAVYDKDKTTRLLLANVEAWKQKLDCVEKSKAQDVQRLQSFIQDLDRIGEQLVGGIGAMRMQLEERRAAEMAMQAGLRRLQELERENATLLSILHGKHKDNPTLLQLLASLQTVKQDLRWHETEHTRLTYLLGQRDKQCSQVSNRLGEAKTRLEKLAWEQSSSDNQQTAVVVRELVIERDRLKAQLAAVGVAPDQQQQKQQRQATPPPPAMTVVKSSSVPVFDDDAESEDFDANAENLAPATPQAPIGTPKANKPLLAPIGSGRRSKLNSSTTNSSKAAASNDCNESPSAALSAAFNRMTVGGGGNGGGSRRPPLGSLQLQ